MSNENFNTQVWTVLGRFDVSTAPPSKTQIKLTTPTALINSINPWRWLRFRRWITYGTSAAAVETIMVTLDLYGDKTIFSLTDEGPRSYSYGTSTIQSGPTTAPLGVVGGGSWIRLPNSAIPDNFLLSLEQFPGNSDLVDVGTHFILEMEWLDGSFETPPVA